MPNRDRRLVPLRLTPAAPVLLVAAFIAAPWPLHRLAENGLLPGGVIEPYATLAVWTAGSGESATIAVRTLEKGTVPIS